MIVIRQVYKAYQVLEIMCFAFFENAQSNLKSRG